VAAMAWKLQSPNDNKFTVHSHRFTVRS